MANISTTLPLPSSPHWAPNTTVTRLVPSTTVPFIPVLQTERGRKKTVSAVSPWGHVHAGRTMMTRTTHSFLLTGRDERERRETRTDIDTAGGREATNEHRARRRTKRRFARAKPRWCDRGGGGGYGRFQTLRAGRRETAAAVADDGWVCVRGRRKKNRLAKTKQQQQLSQITP